MAFTRIMHMTDRVTESVVSYLEGVPIIVSVSCYVGERRYFFSILAMGACLAACLAQAG